MMLAAKRKQTAETMTLLVDAIISGGAYGPLKDPAKAINGFKRALKELF